MDDLQIKLKALALIPGTGSVRYLNVRYTFTKVFSYIIHYTIDDDTKKVYLLRVLNSAREPLY